MAIYHYKLPWPVIDTTTYQLVTNRGDGQLFDLNGTPVTATNTLGVATPISTGPYGTTTPFNAPVEAGYVRFGDAEAAVFSNETFQASEKAAQALAAAQQALTSIEGIASTAAKVSYIERSPDGSIYFTTYPVLEGGGHPVIRTDGTAYIEFQ